MRKRDRTFEGSTLRQTRVSRCPPDRGRSESAGGAFQNVNQGANGQIVSEGPEGANVGIDQRWFRFLDERPRHCLSAQIRNPARLVNGRQRAAYGVRQYGGDEPDWWRVQARSGMRRIR